ncbi:hypothetical protein QBC40DRAFT_78296 [Triangularia verruculosa]|uniref:Uncharacterized protein n=1 Tax=Triangularia verruculosa TaxID=2587418 RepID=A0AAN7AV69_9PEZI|nr:hypothetical protein QBC40DRAFT_78296 [Triangularia verruculosa]
MPPGFQSLGLLASIFVRAASAVGWLYCSVPSTGTLPAQGSHCNTQKHLVRRHIFWRLLVFFTKTILIQPSMPSSRRPTKQPSLRVIFRTLTWHGLARKADSETFKGQGLVQRLIIREGGHGDYGSIRSTKIGGVCNSPSRGQLWTKRDTNGPADFLFSHESIQTCRAQQDTTALSQTFLKLSMVIAWWSDLPTALADASGSAIGLLALSSRAPPAPPKRITVHQLQHAGDRTGRSAQWGGSPRFLDSPSLLSNS